MAFEVTEVLTQVGRGAHNDVVIREDSVSDSHAKLQRRGDGWWVVDMASTNGTFADGTRVDGERSLGDRAELKFGAIRASFRVAGVASGTGSKGETAVLSSALTAKLVEAAKAAPTAAHAPAQKPSAAPVPKGAPRPAAAVAPRSAAAAAPSSGGIPGWIWLVVALAIAGGAFFFLQGR
jgi:pSer/pThr/pTyr-binding forkhead associated (FHA) protein